MADDSAPSSDGGPWLTADPADLPPAPGPSEAARTAPADSFGEADSLERLRLAWPQVLAHLNGKDPRQRRVQALLRDCCRLISVQAGEVVLGFRYHIHKGKLEEPENRRSAEAAISTILGTPYRVQCILETLEAPPDKLTAARTDPLIQEAERQGGRLRRVE